MTPTRTDAIVRKGSLRWVVNTILIFGLLAFSGHASALALRNPEPARIELNEVRRTDVLRQTASFQKIFRAPHATVLPSAYPHANFIWCLLHCQRNLDANLDVYRLVHACSKHKSRSFLIFHSSNNKTADTDQSQA